MKVQLLTLPDCPHAAGAREVLTSALVSSGVAAHIEELDTTAPDTSEALREWGSPTILIDGRDIAEGSPGGASCRLYRNASGRTVGAPPAALVRDAIARALRQ